MCLKYLISVLIYIIVHPGETVADETIVSQEFEQVLSDFIFQYHKDNETDLCKMPLEKYIHEEFIKSNLYEKFQLVKYFAEDSKCENLCLKVNYTIEDNVVNDNIAPILVPKIGDISTNPTVAIDTLPDIVSKDNASTDTASTDNASTDTASTDNASTDTASTDIADKDTATNIEGNKLEDITTIATEGKEGNVENSRNMTDSETGSQRRDNGSEGKKTAIIVAATILAVGGTAVAAFFIYKGVTALLQSGTYVFPG